MFRFFKPRRWAVIVVHCHGEIVIKNKKPKIITNPNVNVCIHYNAEATCITLVNRLHNFVRNKIQTHQFGEIKCEYFKDFIQATDVQQLGEPQSSLHASGIKFIDIDSNIRKLTDVNKIGLWNKNPNIYVEKLFTIAQDVQKKHGWQTGIYIGDNNIDIPRGSMLVKLMSPSNPTITVSQIIERLDLTEMYMKDMTCSVIEDKSLTEEDIKIIQDKVNETVKFHNTLDLQRSMSNNTTPTDDSVIPVYVKLQELDGTVYWYSTIQNTKVYRKPTEDDRKILIPTWTRRALNPSRNYWYTYYDKLNENHEIVSEIASTIVDPYGSHDKLSTSRIEFTPRYIELQEDIDENDPTAGARKYWYVRQSGSKVYEKPTEDDTDIFIPKWEKTGESSWKTSYYTFKSRGYDFDSLERYTETHVDPNSDTLEGELKKSELYGGNRKRKTKCKKTKCKKTKCKKTKK